MGEKKSHLFSFQRQHRLRATICEQRERLYRIAWSWCHDASLAEELVQETQARALAKIDDLREENRAEIWLTRIMANLYRDHFRRPEPETGFEEERICERDKPDESLERAQLVARTREAVDCLSDDQRQVLTLIDLADFSYADTARILDLPMGTVMSRLSRARARLRALLEQKSCPGGRVIPLRKKL